MRILVFGANGYIGSRVTQRLVQDGNQVTGFVRSDKAAEIVHGLSAHSIVAGLDNSEAIEAALKEHEAVIWLAQLTLPEEKRVVGEFLKMLRKTNKKFIFVGGTSVLSIPTNGEWSDKSFSEFDSFVPRALLAIRAETELVVRTASQFGVHAMVFRPPLIFGHGGCKVISDIYHSARKTGAVCYVGRGLNAYSATHVDDFAKLFHLALQKGEAGALYHCVATEVPFRMMAEIIAKKLGVGTRSVTVPEAQEIWDKFSGMTVFASCSRSRSLLAKSVLGWEPAPENSDILEECLHPAYVENAERELASWIKPTTASA